MAANAPEDDGTTLIAPLVARTSAEQVEVFALNVTSPPDTGLGITLSGADAGRVYIGTSPACQLRLNDAKVSRRHIALQVDGTVLRLTDVGSTNGTLVNGVLVQEVSLRGGETVHIGDTELAVELRQPTKTATSLAVSFGRMLGASPEMRRLYPLCERLANSDVSVLIEGEGGTGKELLAESLHRRSARREGAFVVFDCTAIPPSQIDAALFGSEVGAGDGQVREPGAVEQAHGGTLFLDEVAELDTTVQAKVLRILEHGALERRVGEAVPVDVRVIAATRRDIEKEIQAGRFRDDLFFRLAVGRIELPPLRKRSGDIKFLTRHLWKQLSGETSKVPLDVVARFEAYSWPGNVRELRNAVMRRIALGDLAQHTDLGLKDVALQGEEADPIERVVSLGLPLSQSRDLIVEEFERRYLSKLLARHEGNATNAAKAAGVARRYFQLLRSRRGA